MELPNGKHVFCFNVLITISFEKQFHLAFFLLLNEKEIASYALKNVDGYQTVIKLEKKKACFLIYVPSLFLSRTNFKGVKKIFL